MGTIEPNSLLLAGLHKTQPLAEFQCFQTPIYRPARTWCLFHPSLLKMWYKKWQPKDGKHWFQGFGVLRMKRGHQRVASFSPPLESQADREVFYLFLGAQLVPVRGRTCLGCTGSSCLCALTLAMSKQKMPLCFFPLFTIPVALGEALGRGIVWW